MIEVIAQNLEDAKAIEACGGHRIELVSHMDKDGLTPDLSVVESIKRITTLPINVMLRPHNQGFDYDHKTFENLLVILKALNQLAVDGIVFGSLQNKEPNLEQLKKVLSYGQMNTTFHRAVDVSRSPLETYKLLIEFSGVTQILTSGGIGLAEHHLHTLKQMYVVSPQHLLIGSGVNIENLSMFKEHFPLANLHIGSGVRVEGTFKGKIDESLLKKIIKKDNLY